MKHPVKVLVITPYYAPDYGPSAPIYTALCEDLQEMGYDVTVVTEFPNYGGSDAVYPHANKLIAKDTWNGVSLYRVHVWKVPRNSLIMRLLYHTSYNFFSTLAALLVWKPDVIIADAPSLWSGLSLLIKAVVPHVPFIYVVNDIYPDVLVKLGLLNNPKMAKLIEHVEKFFYDRASAISVISEGFRMNLLAKKVSEDKLIVVPICVDTDFFGNFPSDNEIRERWDLLGKFVVLYAGNIGFSQGLEIILDAAKSLSTYPEIVFVIVGEGSTKTALQAKAAQDGLSNVMFIPFQPREKVPLIYAMADICLVTLKKDIVVESVPSKTYTILASSRPVIATVNQGTEVWNLINKTRCGLSVEPENAGELSEAILHLYQNPSLRTDMGSRGRDYVVNHVSRKIASRLYQTQIEQIVTKKKLNTKQANHRKNRLQNK